MRGFHFYFKVLPTVRAYIARPLRWGVTGAPAGCFTRGAFLVVLLFLLARAAFGQQEILVELVLVPTSDRVTVEAQLTPDSTPLLPTAPLHELLGAGFASPWITVEQLRQAYPPVTFQWRPEEMRLYVFDELAVLPATRAFRESHRASAFGVAALPQVSGAFGSWSVDDQKRSLAELGYQWRGRLQVFGRVDDRGNKTWNASASPTPHLFLGANGGTGQRPSVSGRIQAGAMWSLVTWAPEQPIQIAGLVRLGPVQTFASREFGMVTVSPMGTWAVQVARQWESRRTVGRVSFGVVPTSAFSIPITQVR